MTEDDHAISKEDNEKGSRNIFSQVKYYTVQALGLKFISQALMFYQKKKNQKTKWIYSPSAREVEAGVPRKLTSQP